MGRTTILTSTPAGCLMARAIDSGGIANLSRASASSARTQTAFNFDYLRAPLPCLIIRSVASAYAADVGRRTSTEH